MSHPLLTIAAVSIIFLVILTYLLYGIVRLHKEANKKYREINNSLTLLRRALLQVESDDPEEIRTGLQTISVFNDPSRLSILPRLIDLTRSSDHQISRQALTALNKIKRSSQQ